ncbi:MAG: hypothetical protein OXI59_03755, partial [Gemmatimonadota bacterium]|nr:hypothetical protein [Gemmatimonadota bacterium]
MRTGFGFGTGVAFPMMNQTGFPCSMLDVVLNDESCNISFRLDSIQMGPVVNGEFFIGDKQVDLVLYGSFFPMPER